MKTGVPGLSESGTVTTAVRLAFDEEVDEPTEVAQTVAETVEAAGFTCHSVLSTSDRRTMYATVSDDRLTATKLSTLSTRLPETVEATNRALLTDVSQFTRLLEPPVVG